MPIFRLDKTFSVGRNAKVFFKLHGGLTRGEVPDFSEDGDPTESLRKERQLNENQRKTDSEW